LPAGQKPTPELGRLPSPVVHRPAAAAVTHRTDRSHWRIVSCTSFQEGEGEPEQVIDGDPSTYWHSRWKPNPTHNPHELVIDFGASLKVAAVVYRAREDMENGRVKDYEVFFSSDGKTWGKPAVAGSFENSADDEQQAELARPVTARLMKFVVKSEVRGNTYASIAELDIIPAK
jgi:beta-galactosidase